jgi:hypothetical protein
MHMLLQFLLRLSRLSIRGIPTLLCMLSHSLYMGPAKFAYTGEEGRGRKRNVSVRAQVTKSFSKSKRSGPYAYDVGLNPSDPLPDERGGPQSH